jgi:hypothetical protein
VESLEALRRPHPLLDEAMVLLSHVVQVLADYNPPYSKSFVLFLDDRGVLQLREANEYAPSDHILPEVAQIKELVDEYKQAE